MAVHLCHRAESQTRDTEVGSSSDSMHWYRETQAQEDCNVIDIEL
jgi:hypothetical protein